MILYTTSNLMGIIVSNLMGIIVSNIYILVDGLEHEFILVHRGVQSLVQLGHNIITSFKTMCICIYIYVTPYSHLGVKYVKGPITR